MGGGPVSSSASASTSPLLGLKHAMHASSESAQSISSDDQYQLGQSIKPKMGKPTASVAAIADKQVAEDTEESASRNTPLPGILQV